MEGPIGHQVGGASLPMPTVAPTEVDISGRRRWKSLSAARWDDGIYYTWEEWQQYFPRDEVEFALQIWSRAVSKEEHPDKEAELRKSLARDVSKLELLPFEVLMQGSVESVVLQHYVGEGSGPGNSLRAGEDGVADLLGGAGARATLAVEVLAAAPHSLQVRIRCQATGGYLRAHLQGGQSGDVGGCGRLDFLGSAEAVETEATEAAPKTTTVFEVFRREASLPLVCIGAKGGGGMSPFVLRCARGYGKRPRPQLWWRAALMEKAYARAEDPKFQGRRRHAKDPSRGYYTFPEWVEYIDDQEWGGPLETGALALGELLWEECSLEELDSPWTHVGETDGYAMEL